MSRVRASSSAPSLWSERSSDQRRENPRSERSPHRRREPPVRNEVPTEDEKPLVGRNPERSADRRAENADPFPDLAPRGETLSPLDGARVTCAVLTLLWRLGTLVTM